MQEFPRLTLAVEHYDRHIPLLDGTVQAEGIALEVRNVGQSTPGPFGTDRHARMLRDREFDFAELSLSSYLMAVDQQAAFTAVPVFPRRLFSASQMYVNVDAGINGPEDLPGRRVGLSSYQTTLSVLAKGDLQHFYGVDWKSITWVTNVGEVMPFDVPSGVRLERAPQGRTVGEMLAHGEVDAMMTPHPPAPFLAGDSRVARLFRDPRAEEAQYARALGYFPIMHVVAARREVVQRYAASARAIYDAFERARERTYQLWEDPNWSVLAWGRHALEEERALFGRDPWTNGLAANRTNLERFVEYSAQQGLISNALPVESFFWDTTLDT
jgi:4,5-dihydroxyphthalate decarboxylase